MNMINSIIIEAEIGGEVKTRSTKDGYTVANIPIVCRRTFRTIDGKDEQETSCFDVDAFGNLADYAVKYASVGRSVRIVGRLKQDTWQTNSGKKKSKVCIIAEHIEYKPRCLSSVGMEVKK